jgi:lipid II:glycine glycyltransferase (peptidoglycan interpeptide bridge formation enzyme)
MVQWEAIREAKLRGCHTFDFLGISPPEDINHHLAGVSSFKEKFGGKIITI